MTMQGRHARPGIGIGWSILAALWLVSGRGAGAQGVPIPWAWGDNSSGQLGQGYAAYVPFPQKVNRLTGVKAVSAGGYHSLALKPDGTVWAWGLNDFGELGDGTATARYQ